MLKKNIVAIIPARGNSKRILGKNYKKFDGEPIISANSFTASNSPRRVSHEGQDRWLRSSGISEGYRPALPRLDSPGGESSFRDGFRN